MNKKITTLSLLSVCISLAIHPSAQAEPLLPVTAEATEISCPAEMNQLSEDEKRALPESCQASVDNAWLSDEAMLTTVSALGAGALMAIAAASGGSGKSGGGMTDGGGDGDGDGDGGNEGGGDYTDWDIGNVIEGDGQENALEEDTSAGSGEIGNLVTGNNTNNTISGNTDVSEGGKGTVVDGNNTATTNTGESSVSGEGSVGLEVNGDNASVNNEGSSTIEGGGTGTVVNGNGSAVNNNGETSVSGEGSVGLEVNGNDAQVNVNGGTEVSDGGTGIAVNGDNSEVVLNGDMRVTQGATGVRVEGNTASVSNSGNIIVSDAGSVGVNLVSDDAAFVNRGNIEVTDKGQGVVLNGQRFDVLLDGSVTVDAGEARNAATGVMINGSEGSLTIAGDVNVRDVLMTTPEEWERSPNLTGVSVNGHDNQVRIEGALNLDYRGIPASSPGIYANVAFRGLEVSGNGNTLSLPGGINLNYAVESTNNSDVNYHNTMSGIAVSGDDNTLLISGDSTYQVDTGEGYLRGEKYLIHAFGDGNVILLDKDFSLSASYLLGSSLYTASANSELIKVSGQSLIQNSGEMDIDSVGAFQIIVVSGEGTARNEGRISYQGEGISVSSSSLMRALSTDSQVINTESGLLTIRKSSLPESHGLGGSNPFGANGGQTHAGLYAVVGAQAFNQGAIEVAGAGTFGMLGYDNAYLENTGTIRLDVLQQLTDENGGFTGEQASWEQEAARFQMRGSGMYVERNSLAINRGEIEVTNSGVGMFADNSTVMNQGTITLEADHAEAGMLYAMAARNSGIAINDTDGVININTDKGQAFYTEDNGVVVNRGTVNFLDQSIENDHSQMGNVTVYDDYLTGNIWGVEQQLVIDNKLVRHHSEKRFYNQGEIHLREGAEFSRVGAETWFQNTGTLTLEAGTALSAAALHNAGTLKTAVVLDTATLVNEGTLIAGGDNSVVSRTSLYNEAGGLITNDAGVSSAGGTALVYADNRDSNGMELQPLDNTLVNQGTIYATNGFSAIKLDPHYPSDRWVYNLEGGRIIGENPAAPLIQLSRGYHLYNAGEIAVSGDNAVAINAGENSAYNVDVINDGVINVGTEAGKSDGTNGSGLTGIEVASRSNRIYNNAGGVINIWADDSYAFKRVNEGSSAQIINNGAVNLLCDAGCNIFAPGQSGNNGDDRGAPTLPSMPDVPGFVLTETILTRAGESRTLDKRQELEADQVVSHGTLNVKNSLSGDGWLHNTGTLNVSDAGKIVVANLNNTGTLIAGGDNSVVSRTSLYNQAGGLITNDAGVSSAGGTALVYADNQGNGDLGPLANTLVNQGTIYATNGFSALKLESHYPSGRWLYNLEGGRIIGENPAAPLIQLSRGYHLYNVGEITVSGDNAVAVNAGGNTAYNVDVINDGVINVGTEAGKSDGTNGSGLTGIEVASRSNRIYNNAGGVINIWADDSYAFKRVNEGSSAQIINNGAVNLLCDAGCDIFAPGQSGNEGDDRVAPTLPSMPDVPDIAGNWSVVNHYVVGTNADGSAGSLSGRNLYLDDTVKVDTGFTAGTAATTVTLTDVFKGDNIRGEENIGSTTVVWNAVADKNADGNIDVTMTKHDYAALVTDGQVSHLAGTLDKGYTNNSLFNSLNVSSVSALNTALKQLSGVQAESLNREARVLGQRFTMLADTASVTTDSGLSFNVVAKGDARAEMANKVTYDMMSLGQRFDTAYGEVTARYGMARLSGNGGNHRERAGDNGLTGGYSQFFGLSHSLPLSNNNVWENSLRWDLHQLDSRRHLSFEGVNEVANASGRQQQLSFRSEGVKTFTLESGWDVSPFAGMKLRHHMTDGYQEQGAGDFNLSVNRYSETAVDAVAGLRLNYAGKDGWGAQAVLEAGPNLSFSQSQRTASLQGLQGQSFRVEDGKKGGGVNGQAVVGANYQKDNLSFDMNAYQWQEDGAADKGFRLNVTRRF